MRKFQEIFNLTQDGIVGKATWYELVRIYVAVTNLAELRSEGQQFYAVSGQFPGTLQVGSTGESVRQLQYMLAVLAEYIRSIPTVQVDGVFGPATRTAVLAAQGWLGLPETGSVDAATWNGISEQFGGIRNAANSREQDPYGAGTGAVAAFAPAAPVRRQNGQKSGGVAQRYSKTTTLTQFPGNELSLGMRDPL